MEEESFEWRPDWNKDLLASLPSYWRGRGGKVFESWRVLLVADQKRSPGLQSILRAGGAIVGTLIDPITSPTHILVSSQQMKAKIPIDLRDESIIKSIDVIADHLIHIS